MEIKNLINNIFQFGKEKGLEDMEISYNNGQSFSIKVFKQELNDYNLSEAESLHIKGIYNGKMGRSYTEKVDETSVEMLINDVIENAKNISSEDEVEIFAGSKEYKKVNEYNESLSKVSDEDKINFIKKAEELAYATDKRVVQVQVCAYGDDDEKTIFTNTKGLELERKSNLAYSYIGVVVKEGESIKSNYAFKCGRDFSKFSVEEMVNEAVNGAIEQLGATSMKSGNYPVIIRNETMSDLLTAFTGIFSAENIQKNLSMLCGKLNNKIASELLTIIDDPFMEDGLCSKSFDKEGAACTYKKLIENGVLKNYLYNLKTAKKDGIETTGNSTGGNSIAPSNLYIEKGTKSLDEMISSIQSGLLITSLEGLHAGLNAISGDFSLLASGILIEDGKKLRPVEQITVAGNFLDMINNIAEIGNDTKFGLPSNSYVGCPSIKFNSLAIAGE